MSNINGDIIIYIRNGKVRMETSLDAAIVCQALIQVLESTFREKILNIAPGKIILPA